MNVRIQNFMVNKQKRKSNRYLDLALKVFAETAQTVPAYKKFLKQYAIAPKKIIATKDFEAVPITTKENYLKVFPVKTLVPSGIFPPMVSASSGSSGKPFYWPRGDMQEIRGKEMHRIIFEDIFKLKNKKTLAIICFSMGNWIAGTFTLASLREVARQKNSHLSIITPGIDKDDVLAVLRDFAYNFDSVVLLGYPPFIMDIVLAAKESSIDLKKLNLHFVVAGENFSEKWRTLVLKSAGIPQLSERVISIYGTADAGSIGHETPFTILARKLATEHKEFRKELYGEMSFIPTTVTYYPDQTYFEMVNSELVFTTQAGIPLIRYNIKDHGQILSYTYVASLLKKHKLDKFLTKEITRWRNPMIVLKGRHDVSVTFYALNIYPENIHAGLEDDTVSKFVTGKYVISVDQTKDMREQRLKITVELAQDIHITAKLTELVASTIFKHLVELNTEYRKLFHSIHEKALPEITLVTYGHEQFIMKKAKHKWVGKHNT